MASVLFLIYPEAGHLNPSYKIAKSLRLMGHKICYVTLPDFEESALDQGIEFQLIFGQLFPKGFLSAYAREKKLSNIEAILQRMKGEIRQKGFNPFKEFAALLKKIKPDLLVIDLLLCHPLLMPALATIPAVLLNTILFDPWEGPEYPDKFHLNMVELILCPDAFDFSMTARSHRRHYVEASIDLQRKEALLPWERLSPEKSLIFFSLGNQSHLYEHSGRFFESVVEAMRIREDLQAILSIGTQAKAGEFEFPIPNLASIEGAYQIQILKRASMMVTHGGLGSIKECILLGVPMVVFPLTREQPMNAARVVYHGLGVRGNIRAVTTQHILQLIETVEKSPDLKQNISAMQKKFLEAEEAAKGAKIIDEMLSKLLRAK